jgi:hypothetical protein
MDVKEFIGIEGDLEKGIELLKDAIDRIYVLERIFDLAEIGDSDAKRLKRELTQLAVLETLEDAEMRLLQFKKVFDEMKKIVEVREKERKRIPFFYRR